MPRHPWIKWYWSDWRSDPCLRMCSLTARGLWAEMLALMQESDPYGHLLVNGIAPTDTQLAVLAGTPSDQIPGLLDELDSAGVFSRTRTRVIYSRRMVRDERRRKDGEVAEKTGGKVPGSRRHQATVKQEEKPPPPVVVAGVADQPPTNHPPPQKPDAMKKDSDANASGASRAIDPAKRVFDTGKELLCRYGIAKSTAGGLVVEWRKRKPDAELMTILLEAGSKERADIVAYVAGCLNAERSNGGSHETSAEHNARVLAGVRAIRGERRPESVVGGDRGDGDPLLAAVPRHG